MMRGFRSTIVFSAMMATHVAAGTSETITNTNGDTVNLYVAGPDTAPAAVIIVHDWFGVSDFTRASVDRLADAGLRAVAVDLYNGKSATTHERAGELSGALDPDTVQSAMRATLDSLKATQRPVAVIGYSAGAATALRTGAENADTVAAVALIYGGGYDGINDASLGQVNAVLSITGGADGWSYPDQQKLDLRMRTIDKQPETYVYPNANHAFAQPLYDGGNGYDPDATNSMHKVLDDFLTRHLKTGG